MFYNFGAWFKFQILDLIGKNSEVSNTPAYFYLLSVTKKKFYNFETWSMIFFRQWRFS